MPCQNCRTPDCDGGASCPAETTRALNAGQSPLVEPGGVRLPLEDLATAPSLGGDPHPAIDAWCWGAFLLTWVWAIGNRTWIGLLGLITHVGLLGAIADALHIFHVHLPGFVPLLGIVIAVWLGLMGRQLAWRNGKWDDVDHFNRVQRRWTVAGIWCWSALAALALPYLILLAFYVFVAGGRIG